MTSLLPILFKGMYMDTPSFQWPLFYKVPVLSGRVLLTPTSFTLHF